MRIRILKHGEVVMQRRRRFKQVTSLQDRILEWAESARQLAKELPPGCERDELVTKLRQAERAMHLHGWANSTELQRRNKVA